MSKRKPASDNKKANKRPSDQSPEESRAAEVVTVAWMMAALASCLGTLLASLSYGALWFTASGGKITSPMVAIPFLLFFIATITGAICLILTPVAIKIRQSPPPRAVVLFAVFFGAAPLAAAIALAVIY